MIRLAVASLLVLAGWTSLGFAEPSRLSVVVQGGRVSVSAHGVALAVVLTELGRHGGFAIGLDAALEARAARETTTTVLDDLSPEHALRRLLAPASLVFVYAQDGLAEVLAFDDEASDAREITRASAKPRPIVDETGPPMPKPLPLVDESGPPIDKPVPVFDGPSGTKPALASQTDESFLAQPPLDPVVLEAQALTATDASVRWRAMEGLAASGEAERASSTAARALETERNPDVLERALTVLSEQSSVPLDPLLRFAASQNQASLRVRALQMLVARGEDDSRVSGLLIRLARTDRSPDVRASARAILDDLHRPAPR